MSRKRQEIVKRNVVVMGVMGVIALMIEAVTAVTAVTEEICEEVHYRERKSIKAEGTVSRSLIEIYS